MIDIKTQFGISMLLALLIAVLLLGVIFLAWVLYDKFCTWKKSRGEKQRGDNKHS